MEEYVLVPSEFCGNKTQPHHYESFFYFLKGLCASLRRFRDE